MYTFCCQRSTKIIIKCRSLRLLLANSGWCDLRRWYFQYIYSVRVCEMWVRSIWAKIIKSLSKSYLHIVLVLIGSSGSGDGNIATWICMCVLLLHSLTMQTYTAHSTHTPQTHILARPNRILLGVCVRREYKTKAIEKFICIYFQSSERKSFAMEITNLTLIKWLLKCP